MTAKKSTQSTPEVIPPEGKPTEKPTEETTSENPMVSNEAALALRNAAIEDYGKREDSMNEFLAQLPKSVAADIRKETKALLGDLQGAADKLTHAMVRLYNVKQALAQMEDADVESLFSDYGRALVSEGRITNGTLYTLVKKVEVFETLKIADPARAAIMAYSNGDSVIVRRPLTSEEITAHKTAHPGTKVPKGTYEASKYFVRAIEVVEVPEKWTPTTTEYYAGQVVRLAAKLRGKDRSTPAGQTDTSKKERFDTLVDRLEVALIGEAKEDGTGVKGMIVLADKARETTMLQECAETIVTGVCKRLSANMEQVNLLWGSLKEIFEEIEDANKKKAAKAA